MFSSNRVVKNHWVLMSEDNASQVIWGVFVKTPQGGCLLFQFRLDTYPGAARASRPRLSLDRCLEQAWKETKVTSWKEQHKRSKQATKFFCWRYFFFFLSHKVPGQGLGDFKVCAARNYLGLSHGKQGRGRLLESLKSICFQSTYWHRVWKWGTNPKEDCCQKKKGYMHRREQAQN